MWQELNVFSHQRATIEKLKEACQELKQMNQKIIKLAQQIQPYTIEKLFEKDRLEIGVEFLTKNTGYTADNIKDELGQCLDRMHDMREKYEDIRETLGDIFIRFAPEMPEEVMNECMEKLNISPKDMQKIATNIALRSVFHDYCSFHHQRNGKTLMDEFMDMHVAELTNHELIVLNSFRTATFAVIEVDSDLIEDALAVHDLLRHEQYILFDEGLNEKADRGQLIICHIFKESDITLTTDAVIMLPSDSRAAQLVREQIKDAPEDLSPEAVTQYATEVLKLIYDDIIIARENFGPS